LREDERARQGGGGQEVEPAVNRVRAAEGEETTESDDSGPPGLMDVDGNVLSSSSEDEEEVMRRREWVQDGGPNLTESSDVGEESDVSDVDDHQAVDPRPRVGRLRLPALLNGRGRRMADLWRVLEDWPLDMGPGNPGLGLGLLLGLGRRRVVQDDEDSASDGEDNAAYEEGDRERFDRDLPGRHEYLGEGREVRAVGEVDDLVSLPLFSQMHLSLTPGQTLPLHLFHPSLVSMMRTVLASPSKAFGVISLDAEESKWAGTVGTTAHVYEVRESDEVAVGSPQEQEEVGLKVKAKGKQRFRLVSARRQSDGNLVGQVTMLHELDLGDPLDSVRLKSHDRLREGVSMSTVGTAASESGKEAEGGAGSYFGRSLSSEGRGKGESGTHPDIILSSPVKRNRKYCHGMTRILSPLPTWIWDLYDPICLADRVKTELSKLGMARMTAVDSLPENPVDLSWWVAARLPLGDTLKGRILAADSVVQRLRMELSFLEQCQVLVCRRCGKQLGDQQHIFSMSKEGPQGAFVNPGGHVHETLTLHKAKNLRLIGDPSTQYSWFPGYAWTIVECSGCWAHIGWKFTATSSRLVPEKFYGFSRKSIETRREVPRGANANDQPEEVRDIVM